MTRYRRIARTRSHVSMSILSLQQLEMYLLKDLRHLTDETVCAVCHGQLTVVFLRQEVVPQQRRVNQRLHDHVHETRVA